MPSNKPQYIVSRRKGRSWSWLTALVAAALVVAGIFYSTGKWGEHATPTDQAAAPARPGPSTPPVPNASDR
jgi:cytochrome c-type biogenesis protein CcmH/NrfG